MKIIFDQKLIINLVLINQFGFFCTIEFECCFFFVKEYNAANIVLFSTKQIADIFYVIDKVPYL